MHSRVTLLPIRTRAGQHVAVVAVGEGVVVVLHDALAVGPGHADRGAAPVLKDGRAVEQQLVALRISLPLLPACTGLCRPGVLECITQALRTLQPASG